MSIFRLSYSNAEGDIVPLPAAMNNFADVESLKQFAAKHGYSSEKWPDVHKECLREFFSHAAIAPELKLKDPLKEVNWEGFKIALKEERGLFALPWPVFEERIKSGVLNGILDANGALIATINVMPKLVNGIKSRLGIEQLDPQPQVYETGAGWASPSHRGLGIYTKFRQSVLQNTDADDRLIFSQASGKGASHVNVREGWTLVNPRNSPFSSALMGWPAGEGIVGQKYQLSSGLEISLPAEGLYVGNPVSFALNDNNEMTKKAQKFLETHDWEDYHHIWVNDPDKLKRFEQKLREGLDIPSGGEYSQEVETHTYRAWLETIRKSLFNKVSKSSAHLTASADNADWGEFTDKISANDTHDDGPEHSGMK